MSEGVLEYVDVPVRADRVPDVMAMLVEMDRAERGCGAGTDDGLDLPDGWTRERIERQFGLTSDGMRSLQRHLATHPGVRFDGDELAKAIGMKHGWNSIAGMLGGYQRLVQNHIGLRNWPFDFGPDSGGAWAYSMRPDVAAIIAAL